MRSRSRKGRRLALVGVMVGLTFGTLPPSAMSAVPLSFERIHGFDAPGTPAQYNSVGVLQGRTEERQEHPGPDPGTSASAAYFEPLAKTIVSEAKGWQVWAVERRENLLEDHSMLDQAKEDRATPKQLFDYYLGWLTDSSITKHFQLIPDFDVGFARQWGMRVEVEDLRRVVEAAREHGRKVVVGGHSLGGSITTAYATWDFNGKPGAKGLSGLVFIDGGSSPTPVTAELATQSLQRLQNSSPC